MHGGVGEALSLTYYLCSIMLVRSCGSCLLALFQVKARPGNSELGRVRGGGLDVYKAVPTVRSWGCHLPVEICNRVTS